MGRLVFHNRTWPRRIRSGQTGAGRSQVPACGAAVSPLAISERLGRWGGLSPIPPVPSVARRVDLLGGLLLHARHHVADTPAAIILQPKCAVRDCLRWDALGKRAQIFAANGHSSCDFL